MHRKFANSHLWALIAVLSLFWITFAAAFAASIRKTDGHWVYVIDDTYITMAIAKNLADHGNWGPVAHEFSACASSPLWVMIVAAVYRVAGVHELVPLGLNLFFGSAVLILIWHILRRRGATPLACFAIPTAVMLLTPMVPVASTGLEHMLQMLVMLGLAEAASRALADDAPSAARSHANGWLMVLAPLATMVRYEGALMVGVIALLFCMRRRFVAAAALVALTSLPIVISGAIFLAKGWMFLPTSIAMKANAPTLSSWAGFCTFTSKGLLLLRANVHIAILLGTVGLLLLAQRQSIFKRASGIVAVVVLATAALHLQLASLGWFYRYEAYLMCLGIVAIYFLARELPWTKLAEGTAAKPLPLSQLHYAAALASILLVGLPIIERAVRAHAHIPQAAANISQQQCQMGRFLHRYYEGQSVAANDIGAINFMANIHCFDLWGLSDIDVARLRLAKRYDSAKMFALSQQKGVKIAVVYDDWYAPYGGVPRQWVKAAEWTISNNTICGGDTVSFYAVDPTQWPTLHRNLLEFCRELPAEVDFKLIDGRRASRTVIKTVGTVASRF